MGKLVRANKFALDTVLYKVGEDAISDAFSRAADASDSSQVVLIFPTLQEEMQNSSGTGGGSDNYARESKPVSAATASEPAKDENERLRAEWLNLMFTDKSVAVSNPEGPMPVIFEGGKMSSPETLLVWIGDDTDTEASLLEGYASQLGLGSTTSVLCLSWMQHPAGEGFVEVSPTSPKLAD